MLKINVVGCSLADYLYRKVAFSSSAFQNALSVKDGDGGILEGKLIFSEDFETFIKRPYGEVLKEITGKDEPDVFNIGGPGIVGAVNCAQIAGENGVKVAFYGRVGDDKTGKKILGLLSGLPVDITEYKTTQGNSPATDVLSDPEAREGKGERSFINTIGVCNHYGPEDLPSSFFDADVLWYGATALVPKMHDGLTELLKKGHDMGKINILSTVFDFRNEKANPDKRWPLGKSDDSYKYIDLLMVDRDEALRMSGEKEISKAIQFFIDKGVGAVTVTYGAKNFFIWSSGRLFKACPVTSLPTCTLVDEHLAANPSLRGDTTGCGDNFAGGTTASLMLQLEKGLKPGELDLFDAAAWGAASGGFACFTVGGTYFEKKAGEKRAKLLPYYEYALKQYKTVR